MAEVRPLNVLIDINVPLDIFLAREPWLPDAQAVWAAHNRRAIVGHIAAHGFTNLFYIARRIVGVEKAREAVRLCLQTFEVIPKEREMPAIQPIARSRAFSAGKESLSRSTRRVWTTSSDGILCKIS